MYAGQPIWATDKAAIFSPTHRCNLRCPYCISKSPYNLTEDPRVYDSPVWQDLIQNNWMIEISGGEPTLSPKAVYFANRMAAAGAKVLFLTNGTRLREYEQVMRDEVGILACWHPQQVPLSKFYCQSARKNTKYKYLLHPQYLEQCGRFWRDLKMWEDATDNVLNIGVFEGVWMNVFFCADHPRYKFLKDSGKDHYIQHLFAPRKNLIIDCDGRMYGNYYMGQALGSVFDYSLRNIEALQPKPYVAIRKDLKELEKAQSAFEDALKKVFTP